MMDNCFELKYLFLINLKIMLIRLDNQLSLLGHYRSTRRTYKPGSDLAVKRTRYLFWHKNTQRATNIISPPKRKFGGGQLIQNKFLLLPSLPKFYTLVLMGHI